MQLLRHFPPKIYGVYWDWKICLRSIQNIIFVYWRILTFHVVNGPMTAMTEWPRWPSLWQEFNKLTLNNEKTVKMTFSLRQWHETQDTGGTKVPGHLPWPYLYILKHTDYLAGRLIKTIYLLRNLKRLVPCSLLLQIFHRLFQSVACYVVLI